jgi:hypothetical protein
MKIVIATPAYGETFNTPYVQTLFLLTQAMERRKWSTHFAAISYADIAESRNILLTQWYDKMDASHLLFVDADMGFDPQLVFDMVEFDKPLVGAIYPKRQLDLKRFAKAAAEGQPIERALANTQEFVVRKPSRETVRKGFIQVKGCGTGILLVQRACIDAMLKKLPEIIDTTASSRIAKGFDRVIRAFDFLTVDGARLTEDYSFCHRWRRQCGGEVWANVTHEIVHMGMQRFTGRYSDAQGSRVKVIRTPLTVARNVVKAARDAQR